MKELLGFFKPTATRRTVAKESEEFFEFLFVPKFRFADWIPVESHKET
jgi:hypothetical protein